VPSDNHSFSATFLICDASYLKEVDMRSRHGGVASLTFVALLALRSGSYGATPPACTLSEESFFEHLHDHGVAAATTLYQQASQHCPEHSLFSEQAMNRSGLDYLWRKQYEEAIALLQLNVLAYPASFNTWDSLAEAYMHDGQVERAIEHFERSVELNPDNFRGRNLAYLLRHYDKREYQIPMRDGVRLFTIVYSPRDTSTTYPMLLVRTPYSVAPYGEHWYASKVGPSFSFVKEGFIFVRQDARGCFMSQGSWVDMRPFVADKRLPADVDESSDTYDTVSWLIEHIPNHNGKLGLWGTSYRGFSAVMGAIDAHPAISAVSPAAPPADLFIGDDFHHNGAFSPSYAFDFYNRFGRPRPDPTPYVPSRLYEYPTPDGYRFWLSLGSLAAVNSECFFNQIGMWNDLVRHGTYDEYWRARCTLPHLTAMGGPVLMVGGWFDAEDLYGTLATYRAIEEQNPGIQSTLVMGPWAHGAWKDGDGSSLGDISFGSPTAEYFREQVELPFFTASLKGTGELNLPEALVFETGANTWRSFTQWPPETVREQRWHLRAGGTLAPHPSATDDPPFTEFVSDPAHPVPFSQEIRHSFSPAYMVEDQRFAATRPDVLVFESPPLEQALTLAGPLTAVLYVSTSGSDSDWIVKLIDVFPDDLDARGESPRHTPLGGYQMLVRGDVLRAKFRTSFEHPQAMQPGVVTRLELVLHDICHTVLPGHRLMVQIQSTWFPLIDRNPQTFIDIYNAEEKDFKPAHHRLYHTAGTPSHLRLGVLEKPEEAAEPAAAA